MDGRIVFLTQAYDPASAIVGVTRDWVAALARRCPGVDVIALSAPNGGDGPPNVRVFSLGRERGAGRASQAAAFYGALGATLPRARAVFAHMVPRYVLLAFPLAAPLRRPIALWYAQGGVDPGLRLAARLARWIVTPTRDSFPLAGRAIDRRVVVTGHGIDTARYRPATGPPPAAGRFLAAGRLSPSKRYEAALEALATLPHRHDWRLRLAGGPLGAADRPYEARLRALAETLGIAGRLEWPGLVPYDRMPHEYAGAWALVHTSATGSLDKVVLEAMACATPAVSTAPSSRATMGALANDLWCPAGDTPALAACLAAALDWTPAQRADVGAALRYQVAQRHSLARWADQVVALLAGERLASGGGAGR